MSRPSQVIEVNVAELEAVIDRARVQPLADEDYVTLKAAVATLGYLTQMLANGKTTIRRLQQMLFGARTEKTRTVVATQKVSTEAASTQATERPARKGHGRNGAQAYPGASKIQVRHETLQAGNRCPQCPNGKLYHQKTPAYLLRLVGQPPLGATVWELERLRCNLCGEVFTAQEPEGVGPEKYDATSGAMIALLKYGNGLPFHRLSQLQGGMGIPLPPATQWEIVRDMAEVVQPIYGQLIHQAAQATVLHNDDTSAKILALGSKPQSAEGDPQRTGTFTSGIVATQEGREIALFFTGRRHAGENLAEVLKQRAGSLGHPIQMCDALSRNVPQDFLGILAHCLAHARRQFVDVTPQFPDECRYVLGTLAQVYRYDATARLEHMTPEARLAFHKEQSGPLMEKLETWFQEQFAQRHVEPNSGLGKAITYFQKHWVRLTRFLHVPGAPLDNNVAERALKKAILHRKNALFFKTERGAQVADLFMSLIHTCQRSGANPFHYLTALQNHRAEMTANPEFWLPWNYQDALPR
jgi:hypothetical protein